MRYKNYEDRRAEKVKKVKAERDRLEKEGVSPAQGTSTVFKS